MSDDKEKDAPALQAGPPLDSEDQVPAFANLVQVSGGADALTVDFYYVHPAKLQRVLSVPDPVASGDAIRVGDTSRVVSHPVARVALPMTASLDLMVGLFRSTVLGFPGLMAAVGGAGARMEEITVLAEQLKGLMEKIDQEPTAPREDRER